MISVGIDPGLSGAVVELDEDGKVIAYHDTPTIRLAKGRTKRDYDLFGMREALADCDSGRIYLETQQAMPKQGVSSTFKIGRGFGLWEGLLVGLGLRYETVRPATWQKSMLNGVPGEGKARSLLKAGQLFPDLPLTKPRGRVASMDGRADAALIALWGLRRMRGEG